MNDNRERALGTDEMVRELDELYQFALRVLGTYDLNGDAAGENVSTLERTVFYTRLFDAQLRHNGPDLWIFNGYAESDTHHVRSALDVLSTEAARGARAALDALHELVPQRNAFSEEPSSDALEAFIIEREKEAYALYDEVREQLIADLYHYATSHPEAKLERGDDAFEERRAPPGESYLPYVSQALRWCDELLGRLENLALVAMDRDAGDQADIIFDLHLRIGALCAEVAETHEQERDGRNLEEESKLP